MTPPAVTLDGVGVRLGRTHALTDLSLSLPADAVVGLLGRNGAGKSTLLRVLAGRLPTHTGTATVAGVEVSRLGRHPGLVHLSTGRWPGAFGATVATLARDLARVQAHFDLDRAHALLTRFGIAPGTPLRHLSGGEQSAASACLALASRAPVTLLDEPDTGVDVPRRTLLTEAIIEEQEIQPRTWVFSTHVIDERAPLFDEVVVLAAGRLVAAGPADEVTAAWVRLEGDFDALVAMPHLGPVDRMGGRSSAVVAADAVPAGSHRQVHALSLGTVVTALTDTHWEGR
jgi:ABC-2 type transport system ATP-binding protein